MNHYNQFYKLLLFSAFFLLPAMHGWTQIDETTEISKAESNESYRTLKSKYNYKNYVYDSHDRYNPFLSGIASALLPGAGQFITGEPGRGMLYLGGIGVSAMTFLVGYSMVWNGDSKAGLVLLTGFAGFFTFYFANIVNAVRIAKVKNLALANKMAAVRIRPQVKFRNCRQPIDTFGLTLQWSF